MALEVATRRFRFGFVVLKRRWLVELTIGLLGKLPPFQNV